MPLYTYPIPEARPVAGGTTYYIIPGVDIYTIATSAPGGPKVLYSAFYVTTPIVIDQLAAEVTTQSSATTFSMAVYVADTSWQPGTQLAVSTGNSSASPGTKTASVSLALSPGRYLTAITAADNTVQYRRGLGGMRYGAYAFGSNSATSRWQVSSTQTLQNPGTAWVAGSVTSGEEYYVWLRISVA